MNDVNWNGGDVAGIVIILMLIVLAFIIYWLPTIIARKRHHPDTTSIAIVNFFFGWTMLGWVIALAWACKSIAQPVYVVNSVPVYPQQPQVYPPYPTNYIPPPTDFSGARTLIPLPQREQPKP